MSTYDESTLDALQESAEKWFLIYNGTLADKGSANCPLCKLFVGDGCRGCPVYEDTKEPYCVGTPYYSFRDECFKNRSLEEFIPSTGLFAKTDQERRLALSMYTYLVNLALSARIS